MFSASALGRLASWALLAFALRLDGSAPGMPYPRDRLFAPTRKSVEASCSGLRAHSLSFMQTSSTNATARSLLRLLRCG